MVADLVRSGSQRLRLVLATANPDKAAEIAAILAGSPIDLEARPISLTEVAETGDTLEENARIKALAVLDAFGELRSKDAGRSVDEDRSGLVAAVADDTGLEVVALGGAPGVFSSRYAGPRATYAENVAKLLSELRGAGDRRARFRTVALAAFPDGRELAAEGVVEGVIATSARGGGGFGYDPVFIPDGGHGLTFAELEPEAKHAISHRGRALRGLLDLLLISGVQGR
jgi:XTP/dITP diphosphohydrolase